MPDLGVESLLGTADGELAQTLRDRLALSTRYLANWYKATSGSEERTIWYAKIDALRAKIESLYQRLLAPANATFVGRSEVADYEDASASWAQLWRELTLSSDTIDISLVDRAGSALDTLAQAPGLLVPQIGNEIGKAIGAALGGFLAQTWPYLAGAAALGVVYVFRAPLVALIKKAVPA